jgi:hypothetical protein
MSGRSFFLNGFITDFAVQLDDSPLDVGSQLAVIGTQ